MIQNNNFSMIKIAFLLFLINLIVSEHKSLQLRGSADLGYYTVDVEIGTPP